MKRILITGSSGTIGTELVHRLKEFTEIDVIPLDYHRNRWIDIDTLEHDLRRDDAFMRFKDLELVVHLAANARVHELVKDPGKARDNVTSTYNALEIARQNDADFLFASSREVYGDGHTTATKEDNVDITETESPYTASKIAGESFVHSYAKCYDMDVNIVRFSNVYGRYDASNRVVPLFIAQAANDREITVYGEDKTLDFTFIDDAVDGIFPFITTEVANHTTYNIASGEGHTILELAELVVDKMDSKSDITVEENRTGEISTYIADIDRARQDLGYDPGVSFEEGVELAIEWYEDQDLYDEILP